MASKDVLQPAENPTRFYTNELFTLAEVGPYGENDVEDIIGGQEQLHDPRLDLLRDEATQAKQAELT